MNVDEPLPPEEATYPKDAWQLLSPAMTANRRARMTSVASRRTRQIRLVIQDIYHPHNISACLRSADAFGIQDVDIVTLRQRFSPSTVAKGVTQWLTMQRYHTVQSCVQSLKASGFKIAAGLPRPDALPLTELPVDTKLAVVFGNEHAGIDQEWIKEVDYAFTIPMAGMVESLNISVSAAITLFHLTDKLRRCKDATRCLLSPNEQQALLNAWACRQTAQYEEVLAGLRRGPNRAT